MGSKRLLKKVSHFFSWILTNKSTRKQIHLRLPFFGRFSIRIFHQTGGKIRGVEIVNKTKNQKMGNKRTKNGKEKMNRRRKPSFQIGKNLCEKATKNLLPTNVFLFSFLFLSFSFSFFFSFFFFAKLTSGNLKRAKGGKRNPRQEERKP